MATKNILDQPTPEERRKQYQSIADFLFPQEEAADVEAFKNVHRMYDKETGESVFIGQDPSGEQLERIPMDSTLSLSHKAPKAPFDPSKDRNTATDMIQYYMNMFGEDEDYDATEERRLKEANRIARGMGASMPKDILGKHPDSPSWSDELSEWQMKTKTPKYYSEHIENLEKVLEGDIFGVDRVRVYKNDLPMIKNYVKAVQAGFQGDKYGDWFQVNDDGNLEINPLVRNKDEAKEGLARLEANYPLVELQAALERLKGFGIDINVLLSAEAVIAQVDAAIDLME